MSNVVINLTCHEGLKQFELDSQICEVIKVKGVSDTLIDIYYGKENGISLTEARVIKANKLRMLMEQIDIPKSVPCLIGGTRYLFNVLVDLLPERKLIYCP